MAKKLAKKEQKNMAKKLWENRGARYMEMVDEFIISNFDSKDKDVRRDCHKLFGKVFDANISKAALITKNESGGQKELPTVLAQALNAFMHQSTQPMIEVEEAELVNDEEAVKIRNATRK